MTVTVGTQDLVMKYAPINQTVNYVPSYANQDELDEAPVVLVHHLPNNGGVMIESYAVHEAEARNIRGNTKGSNYRQD